MRGDLRSVWFWLTLAALAVLALFLLLPLFNVLVGSFGGSSGRSGWSLVRQDGKYLTAVVNTLVLGGVVTLLASLIGVPMA